MLVRLVRLACLVRLARRTALAWQARRTRLSSIVGWRLSPLPSPMPPCYSVNSKISLGASNPSTVNWRTRP